MSEITIAGKTPQEYFDEALNNPEVFKIYANGFTTGIGNGDITIVLQLGPKPVAMVNLSFTVAKTLGLRLNGTILELEKGSGNTIMTTQDIGKAIGLPEQESDK